jgi:hypothetical protein
VRFDFQKKHPIGPHARSAGAVEPHHGCWAIDANDFDPTAIWAKMVGSNRVANLLDALQPGIDGHGNGSIVALAMAMSRFNC